MGIGQWYELSADWGDLMNHLKYVCSNAFNQNSLPPPKAIILRYIQLSAETVGGRLGAISDYVKFRNVVDG